jgi:hypothetical protein
MSSNFPNGETRASMSARTVNIPRSLRESLEDAAAALSTTRSRLSAIAVRGWLEREYPAYPEFPCQHPEEYSIP